MLTKELITSKNPQILDITQLKHLNIYGEQIKDISLLSEMPNLKYVSLSCNEISSLTPLSSCKKLRELYLRNNNINSFQELYHLKDLLHLQVLWLEGNPICQDIAYRERVFKLLPQVKILDDKKRILNFDKKFWRKRIKTEEQKAENDYDVNINIRNRKKVVLKRVFSNLDSEEDGKVIDTMNNISVYQNKKLNFNFNLGHKRGEFSELKIKFNNKDNYSAQKENKIFSKLKLKIKREENKNNLYNNKMFNNYINSGKPKPRRKLTVETYYNPIPFIRENSTVQNSAFADGNKKKLFRNINYENKVINNSKYFGNNTKDICQFINKIDNINDLLLIKSIIDKKISTLSKCI